MIYLLEAFLVFSLVAGTVTTRGKRNTYHLLGKVDYTCQSPQTSPCRIGDPKCRCE